MLGGERIDQTTQYRFGIADQCHGGRRKPFRLVRIGIDANDGEIRIDPPLRIAVEKPRPHTEHHVGFAPQFPAERQRDA